MGPHYRKALTLQTATFTDDGLEAVATWASASVEVTLVEAPWELKAKAQALGRQATHVAMLPKGSPVMPGTHRFLDGTRVLEVVHVMNGARGVLAILEETK